MGPCPWSSGECGPPSPLSRTHTGSQTLKQWAQGLHGSAPVLCILWLLALCYVDLLTVGTGVSLTLFACYFPPVGLPWPASIWEISPCLIVSCFVLLGYCLLKAPRLSEGKQKEEWILERGELRAELGGVEEGEMVVRIVWEKNLFSIFKSGYLKKILSASSSFCFS